MVNVPGESTACHTPLDTPWGLENSSLGPGSGGLSDTTWAYSWRSFSPKKLKHVGEAKGGLRLCLAWAHVTQIWETRSRHQDRNTSFILGVVLASPQPKCTERRTISRIWGQTLGTQMQSFTGGISLSRKDGELSPGEKAGSWGAHRSERKHTLRPERKKMLGHNVWFIINAC